jgi:hypothetical protein
MTNLDKVLLGVVVNNDDPTRSGKAKIRVRGIFDEIPDEDLPWASQASVVSFGSKEGGGQISVPKIGSLVLVEFDNGDWYVPYYTSTWGTDPSLIESFSKDENGESYFGAHSLIYDSDAKPGPLKLIYQANNGMLIELGDSKFHLSYDGSDLKVIIKIKDNEIVMDGNKIVVNSDNIQLGKDAMESIIKGDTFLAFFNSHVHATPAGPSAPPTAPMTDLQLSQVSKTK